MAITRRVFEHSSTGYNKRRLIGRYGSAGRRRCSINVPSNGQSNTARYMEKRRRWFYIDPETRQSWFDERYVCACDTRLWSIAASTVTAILTFVSPLCVSNANAIDECDVKFGIVCSHTYAVESYNGSVLRLSRLERKQMGAYLCIASNDVPPAVSKRVSLSVHCKPALNL